MQTRTILGLFLVACLALAAHKQTVAAHVFDPAITANLDAGGSLSDICGIAGEEGTASPGHCGLCLPAQALPGTAFEPSRLGVVFSNVTSACHAGADATLKPRLALCNSVRAPPATT